MHPSMREYDLVVIGSGPAGRRRPSPPPNSANRARDRTIAQMLGGVCINTGTIPSKTLREAVIYLTGLSQRELYGRATGSRKTSPSPT